MDSLTRGGMWLLDAPTALTGVRAALDPNTTYGQELDLWWNQDWERAQREAGGISTGERWAQDFRRKGGFDQNEAINWIPREIRKPVVDFAIELAGDIIEDPVAIASLGTYGVVKGAAKLGGKQLLKSGGKAASSKMGQRILKAVAAKEAVETPIGLGMMGYGGFNTFQAANEAYNKGDMGNATELFVTALLQAGAGGYMSKDYWKGKRTAGGGEPPVAAEFGEGAQGDTLLAALEGQTPGGTIRDPETGLPMRSDVLQRPEDFGRAELAGLTGMEPDMAPKLWQGKQDPTGRWEIDAGEDLFTPQAGKEDWLPAGADEPTWTSPALEPDEVSAVKGAVETLRAATNRAIQSEWKKAQSMESNAMGFTRGDPAPPDVEIKFLDADELYDPAQLPPISAVRTADGRYVVEIDPNSAEIKTAMHGTPEQRIKNLRELWSHEVAHFLPGMSSSIQQPYSRQVTPVEPMSGEQIRGGQAGALRGGGHSRGFAVDEPFTDLTHMFRRDVIDAHLKKQDSALGKVMGKVKDRAPLEGKADIEAGSYRPDIAQMAQRLGMRGTGEQLVDFDPSPMGPERSAARVRGGGEEWAPREGEKVAVWGSGETGWFTRDPKRAASYPGELKRVEISAEEWRAGREAAAAQGLPTPNDVFLDPGVSRRGTAQEKPDVSTEIVVDRSEASVRKFERPSLEAVRKKVRETPEYQEAGMWLKDLKAEHDAYVNAGEPVPDDLMADYRDAIDAFDEAKSTVLYTQKQKKQKGEKSKVLPFERSRMSRGAATPEDSTVIDVLRRKKEGEWKDLSPEEVNKEIDTFLKAAKKNIAGLDTTKIRAAVRAKTERGYAAKAREAAEEAVKVAAPPKEKKRSVFGELYAKLRPGKKEKPPVVKAAPKPPSPKTETKKRAAEDKPTSPSELKKGTPEYEAAAAKAREAFGRLTQRKRAGGRLGHSALDDIRDLEAVADFAGDFNLDRVGELGVDVTELDRARAALRSVWASWAKSPEKQRHISQMFGMSWKSLDRRYSAVLEKLTGQSGARIRGTGKRTARKVRERVAGERAAGRDTSVDDVQRAVVAEEESKKVVGGALRKAWDATRKVQQMNLTTMKAVREADRAELGTFEEMATSAEKSTQEAVDTALAAGDDDALRVAVKRQNTLKKLKEEHDAAKRKVEAEKAPKTEVKEEPKAKEEEDDFYPGMHKPGEERSRARVRGGTPPPGVGKVKKGKKKGRARGMWPIGKGAPSPEGRSVKTRVARAVTEEKRGVEVTGKEAIELREREQGPIKELRHKIKTLRKQSMQRRRNVRLSTIRTLRADIKQLRRRGLPVPEEVVRQVAELQTQVMGPSGPPVRTQAPAKAPEPQTILDDPAAWVEASRKRTEAGKDPIETPDVRSGSFKESGKGQESYRSWLNQAINMVKALAGGDMDALAKATRVEGPKPTEGKVSRVGEKPVPKSKREQLLDVENVKERERTALGTIRALVEDAKKRLALSRGTRRTRVDAAKRKAEIETMAKAITEKWELITSKLHAHKKLISRTEVLKRNRAAKKKNLKPYDYPDVHEELSFGNEIDYNKEYQTSAKTEAAAKKRALEEATEEWEKKNAPETDAQLAAQARVENKIFRDALVALRSALEQQGKQKDAPGYIHRILLDIPDAGRIVKKQDEKTGRYSVVEPEPPSPKEWDKLLASVNERIAQLDAITERSARAVKKGKKPLTGRPTAKGDADVRPNPAGSTEGPLTRRYIEMDLDDFPTLVGPRHAIKKKIKLYYSGSNWLSDKDAFYSLYTQMQEVPGYKERLNVDPDWKEVEVDNPNYNPDKPDSQETITVNELTDESFNAMQDQMNDVLPGGIEAVTQKTLKFQQTSVKEAVGTRVRSEVVGGDIRERPGTFLDSEGKTRTVGKLERPGGTETQPRALAAKSSGKGSEGPIAESKATEALTSMLGEDTVLQKQLEALEEPIAGLHKIADTHKLRGDRALASNVSKLLANSPQRGIGAAGYTFFTRRGNNWYRNEKAWKQAEKDLYTTLPQRWAEASKDPTRTGEAADIKLRMDEIAAAMDAATWIDLTRKDAFSTSMKPREGKKQETRPEFEHEKIAKIRKKVDIETVPAGLLIEPDEKTGRIGVELEPEGVAGATYKELLGQLKTEAQFEDFLTSLAQKKYGIKDADGKWINIAETDLHPVRDRNQILEKRLLREAWRKLHPRRGSQLPKTRSVGTQESNKKLAARIRAVKSGRLTPEVMADLVAKSTAALEKRMQAEGGPNWRNKAMRKEWQTQQERLHSQEKGPGWDDAAIEAELKAQKKRDEELKEGSGAPLKAEVETGKQTLEEKDKAIEDYFDAVEGEERSEARVRGNRRRRRLTEDEIDALPDHMQEQVRLLNAADPNDTAMVGGPVADVASAVADAAVKTGQLARTTMTMGDLSIVFRQTLENTMSHPLMAARRGGEMLKATGSAGYYKKAMDGMKQRQNYKIAKAAGLNPPEFGRETAEFAGGDVISGIAREGVSLGGITVPGTKLAGKALELVKNPSERSYVYYQAKTMQDMFDLLYQKGRDAGAFAPSVPMADQIAFLKDISTAINAMNARSPITNAKWKKTAEALFFSPQMIKSRVEVLADLLTLGGRYKSKLARKVIMKEHGRGFVGIGALGLGAYATLKQLGHEPEVETDPRSSDFMKLRVGDVRVDWMGGHQQYARFVAQGLSGTRKETTTGQVKKVSRMDLLQRMTRSKMAPLPGKVWDALTGRSMGGDKVDLLDKKSVGILFRDLFVPLAGADVMNIYKEDPELAKILVAPIMLGMGAQHWSTAGDWRNISEPVKKDTREVYAELKKRNLRGPRPGRSFTLPGKDKLGRKNRYSLSAGEYKEFQMGVMPDVMAALKKHIESPRYQKLDDEAKRKNLYQMIRRYNRKFSAARKGREKLMRENS